MEKIKALPAERTDWAGMLTDFSIDRLMAIDLEWNIVFWNRASELSSGLTKEAVIGKNLLDIFDTIKDDEEMMQAIKDAFAGNKTFVNADKTKPHRHYYENHFVPLRDAGNKMIGVMHIMHDVAHRLKAETDLRNLNLALEEKYEQLEKLSRELANFTSITTQNIREPLKFIYSSLELLITAEGRHFTDSSKANLRRMQVSLNRINRLIDDIVQLFRINISVLPGSGVDLDEVMQLAQQKLSRRIQESNAVINVGKLPSVNGMTEMLVLLFQNLIDNALKFSRDEVSPVIDITASAVTVNEATRQPAADGRRYSCISVRDNGIGIEKKDQKKIFEMFEQLQDKKRYPGTGLGLAFCEKIIQAHGGFILLESEPGKGSVFNCYFPVDASVN